MQSQPSPSASLPKPPVLLARSPAKPAAGTSKLAGHYIVTESLPQRALHEVDRTRSQPSTSKLRKEIQRRLDILTSECEFLIPDWLEQSAFLDETTQATQAEIARAEQLRSIDEFDLEGHLEAWHGLKQTWKQAGIPAVFPRLEVRLYKARADAFTPQQKEDREQREEAEENGVMQRLAELLKRIDPGHTPAIDVEFFYTRTVGPAASLMQAS